MERSEIQMVVVIVADQDEVDGWKTLDAHTWICHGIDAEHTRPDRIEQNRIGDDVQVWRLDECRGVADPEHPDSMEHRLCRRSIERCFETRRPVLPLGSQFPRDLDFLPG